MADRKKKYRTKGSGSIVKRGNTYYLQYMVNGKLKRISLKCTSEKEANKKAKEILLPLQTADTKEKIATQIAEARNLTRQGKVPISDMWKFYLESSARPDSGPGTLNNYKGQLQRFINWCEKLYPNIQKLEQITDDIAKEYANDLWKSGISSKTFNDHIKALMLINRVLSSSLGKENPWNCIPRKAENKQSKKEFSEEEVLKILDSLNDANLHLMHREEMKVLFHLGAWTGLRFIDCTLMKWEHIDSNRNLIIACKPQKTARKTNQTVTIPIHPLLRDSLNKAQEWKENEYVLPKVAKRYLENSDCVNKDVIRVFEYNGFETKKELDGVQRKRKANIYGFHSFRHSFVSFCAKAGVPLPVVQAIVGHGNPAITRHYIHIGEESVKQAIHALPMGQEDEKKTSDQKIGEILDFLKRQKKLTSNEKKIIKIIESAK